MLSPGSRNTAVQTMAVVLVPLLLDLTFSQRIRGGPRQMSLITQPGAPSDINPQFVEPNPIIEPGCQRSVGDIVSVAALCTALDMALHLRPLDCDPFLHGYGQKCSDAQLTIGVWDIPLIGLSGVELLIPFYVTRGSSVLPVGNKILHQSYRICPEHRVFIPPNVRSLLTKELCFQTYTEPTSSADQGAVRTHLFVVTSKSMSFRIFFISVSSFVSSQIVMDHLKKRFSCGKLLIGLHQGFTGTRTYLSRT